MTIGVYAIMNKTNTKLYVGSATISIKQRFYLHRSDLRHNRHHSKHLQAAWNKYGEGSFELIVIEECSPEDCLVLEQYWIDYYDVCNPECGYNSAPIAGNTLGLKPSEETKAKISAALVGKTKGMKKTAEHAANISAALKGKKRKKDRPEITIGSEFGDWTVLSERNDSRRHVCLCVCGRTALVHETNLLGGRSTRCRKCSNKYNNRMRTKIG